ncbi:MAG: DUF4838 domain-containing protein, partial [Clostridia bacterium]|nr:DUF4838 domain-containing protein [Clostridia bacterium]
QENGCRWLYPGIDGEFIPMQDIVATKYHKMADCRFRGQCNEGAEFQPNMMETIDFTPKIGLNVYMLEFSNPDYYSHYYDHKYNPTREPEPVTPETRLQWKRQCEAEIAKRGLQFHDMGHGWTIEPFGIEPVNDPTIPEDAVQYLALCHGKRGLFKGLHPYNTNFCMSNPEARRIVVNHIVNYAKNHTNVDFLHVWLADCWNNHCECEECQKKTPSDWYVILMNELDAELDARGMDTRIVFICYVDTSWPPQTETINHPRRFTLLVAPISRDYTKAVSEDASGATYPPYERNKIELLPEVDQYVKAGQEWQKKCGVEAMLYEYHFYVNQYQDPGTLNFSRVVYDDIRNYRKNGLNGLINDCSQRSFWPNGFAFYIYGQLQFDTSLSYEELMEDYFSHAYGEDWKEVLAIFEKLEAAMDTRYIARKKYVDLKYGKNFNPAMVEGFRKVPGIVADAKPFLDAHKNHPKRVQSVSYKLLRYYMEYCEGLAKCFALKCLGADVEALEAYRKFLADTGKYEVEIETYYDHYMANHYFGHRVFERFENLIGIGDSYAVQ